MTHSLHRCGSPESLKGDYVLIAMAARVNKATVGPQLSKVAEIMFEAGLVNTGSTFLQTNLPLGFDREDFTRRIAGANALLCVFSSKDALRTALIALKEARIGVSITVSGLIDEVQSLAEELELKPHTINFSMGVIGKTERLPEPEVMEVATMCGHALIASGLIKKEMRDVANGAVTAEDASMILGRPCICGIFNLDRSRELLLQAAQRAG